MHLPARLLTAVVAAVSTLLVCVATAPPAQAATLVVGQICSVMPAPVRASASTSAPIVRTVPSGERVSGAASSTWLRVAGGYIALKFVCRRATVALDAPVVRRVSLPGLVAPAPAPAYRMVQPTGTHGSPTTPFGWRIHPITGEPQFHQGVDIGDLAGAPIVAAADGVVIAAAYSWSAGNYVEIRHAQFGSVVTRYLHQSKYVVAVGQVVKAGQLIGYVGSTGSASKAHLHFTVKVNDEPVDPVGWIGPLDQLAP